MAKEAKRKALRKRAGGTSKWEGLQAMGGTAFDARALALESLRFCLREEAGRAAEWYNDDVQLGASIGAACSVRQACAAWPSGHKTLLRLAACTSVQLMQLAELDLTAAAAQGHVSPGVGGALAVLVASSTALRHLRVGGGAIGVEGVAPLALVLRRNSSLLSLALDGQPLPLRSEQQPPHGHAARWAAAAMFEREQANLSRMNLGPLSAVVLGSLLEGNTALRSLNLYRNKLMRIGGVARALSESSSALTSLDLAHNQLGPAAGFELAVALQSNMALTAVSLYSNYVGEGAAAALWASARRHPQLLELSLVSNGISVQAREILRESTYTYTYTYMHIHIHMHMHMHMHMHTHMHIHMQARETLRESVAEWLAARGLLQCSSASAAEVREGKGSFHLLLDGRDKPRLTADGVSRDVASGLAEKSAEQPKPPEGAADLALGKRAWASAEEGPALGAANAVDGSPRTRWASGHDTAPVIMHAWYPQWLAVDLGQEQQVRQVRVTWEDAYAVCYEIQGRTSDAQEWVTLNEVDAAWPGEVVSAVPSGCVARELRVRCLRRGTEFGYSIRQLAVY